MSRSYKKNPCYTDGKAGTIKDSKRCANKRTRNIEDIPNYGGYKKVSCSYHIHNYCSRWTWEDAQQEWENASDDNYFKRTYPNLKDFYRYWLKCYKTK